MSCKLCKLMIESDERVYGCFKSSCEECVCVSCYEGCIHIHKGDEVVVTKHSNYNRDMTLSYDELWSGLNMRSEEYGEFIASGMVYVRDLSNAEWDALKIEHSEVVMLYPTYIVGDVVSFRSHRLDEDTWFNPAVITKIDATQTVKTYTLRYTDGNEYTRVEALIRQPKENRTYSVS